MRRRRRDFLISTVMTSGNTGQPGREGKGLSMRVKASFALLFFCVVGLSLHTPPTFADPTADQSSLDLLRRKGDEKLTSGEFASALVFYQEAAKAAPNDPGLQFRIVKAAAGAKDAQAGLA